MHTHTCVLSHARDPGLRVLARGRVAAHAGKEPRAHLAGFERGMKGHACTVPLLFADFSEPLSCYLLCEIL